MKYPFCALLLSAGFASSVSAQVDVKLTGSTAFRSSLYTALLSMYGANLTSANAGLQTNSTTLVVSVINPNGANRYTMTGTIPALFGANTVTVRANLTGSVEGIQSLTQGLNETYLTDAIPAAPGDIAHTQTFTAQADLALSDVFQITSIYKNPVLVDAKVGVVAFAWTRGINCPATLNNITSQQAKLLFAAGTLPFGYFTGNLSDQTPMYLVGRTPLSGTRYTAQADCGYGATASSSLYKLTAGNWVQDLVGFSSGSGVAGVLNDAGNNAGNGYGVSYLGVSDSNNVNAGANALSFNGVAYSKPAIRNGSYSMWGFEHIYDRPSIGNNAKTLRGNATSGLVKAIDDALAAPSNVNVQLSTMLVDRNADGGEITP